MTAVGSLIILAIIMSGCFGVYLRLRQIQNVSRNRNTVPQDFVSEVSLSDHQRAADYTIERTRFGIAELVFDTLISILWLTTWLSPLYLFVAHYSESSITRSVMVVLSFGIISHFLEMPFSLFNSFWIEEKFGFNRLTLKTFILDELKTSLLTCIIMIPALYAMFALLGALPDTWWIFSYAIFMTLTVAMTVIYPTLIAPLFNKFTPMGEGATKERMESLLLKCGFESKGLFIMDASKRSAHGNAYFSGFGKGKRIVFFDTLLEKHTLEEIESILAHELGHFKYGHVFQIIVQSAVLALIAFFAIYYAFSSGIISNWFNLQNDPGVVLIALLLAKEPISLILTPVLSWRSRKAEFEADDFARKIVGQEAMVSALTRLTRDNLASLTPDPLFAAFYFSHPPVPLRVAQLRIEVS
jgi:STE24 endopeptidase